MALRHIVMMRLKAGIFDAEAEADYKRTFLALKEAFPGRILDVKVSRNTVERKQNMTVMVEMLLKDETVLTEYLKHPLHRGIGERYDPHVEAIASFDCGTDRTAL